MVLAIDNNKFIKMLAFQLVLKLEKLKELAIEDLRQEILATVYSIPNELYIRTGQLLRSIDSTPVQIKGNQITFDIFFNEDLMEHESIFGSTKGMPVDVSLLTNMGHHHKTKMLPKRLHQYDGYGYVEEEIKKIKKKLQQYMKEIEVVEVKKL